MVSLQRAVQRSLTARNNSETVNARHREIQAVGNPAKRAGLLALHSLVLKHPGLMASLTDLDQRLGNISYLDKGSHSTVYRLDEETVLKIDQQSIAMSAHERKLQADKMRDEHSAHLTYVGSVILPHEIIIRRHPLDHEQHAIQIIQPYRAIKPLRLLAKSEADIPQVSADIRLAHQLNPNLAGQLGPMIERSRLLNEDRQLATDITDHYNAGIDTTTGSLIVIDGQPVNTARPEIGAAMNHYLDNLEVALSLAVA